MNKSKYGRNGDTKIAKIDNKDAHVNAWEAHLKDRYGKDAEPLIKQLGSGSINPVTGLKEYHQNGLKIWQSGWHPHPHLSDYTWSNNPIANAFDHILPTENTGWLSNIQSSASEIEDQTEDIVKEGMLGLAGDVDAYLGEDGFLERERGITFDKIEQEKDSYSFKGQQDLMNVTDVRDTQISKTNLVTSGDITNKADDAQKYVNREYNLNVDKTMTGVDQANLSYEKNRVDFLKGIRTEMNELLLRYSEITDEAYGGSTAYNDLLTLLEEENNTGG